MSRFDRPLPERLRQHAREQPERAAYSWFDQTITWAELDRQSDAFAARLQAFGVKKGEPVALFLGNCPHYVMAHFGIQKIGAIVCPCGPRFKEHELHCQLEVRFVAALPATGAGKVLRQLLLEPETAG